MPITSYVLYEKLKPKLGEEETRLLLEHIGEFIEKGSATKEEVVPIKEFIEKRAVTKEEVIPIKEFVEKRAVTKDEIIPIKEFIEKRAVTKDEIIPIKEFVEKRAATKDDIHRLEADIARAATKEDIHRLEIEIVNLRAYVERRIDRLFYFIILLFIIFNGDKVVTLFINVWNLFKG